MKKYLYAVLLGLAGIGALYFMMWQMGLGDFAESPQQVLVTRSVNRVVAGGRAGLLFEGVHRDGYVRILVRCKDTAEDLRLRQGEESREVCGIFIRLESVRGDRAAMVQVRWE